MKNNVCTAAALHACTGCGACSAICPVGAIKIVEAEDGFYRPEIDVPKCTACGLCTKVCYRCDAQFAPQEQEQHTCYSAVNKSEAELKSASSGAVSVELMRECLRQGYYVVGVAYDVVLGRAVTRIAKCEEELEQFKGSKYFQSYTADAYREIVADKSEQKYAIFGTPCQIYAFSKLGEVTRRRDRYLLVDIFCHGCPSLKLWDKYLAYVQKKHEVDRFDEIKFRSKAHGWHEFAFDFIKDQKEVHNKKCNDPFYEIFFGMTAMNEACYDCVARSSVEKTDIRMGDFWGWQFDTDRKGVSAVVINTPRGEQLFDAVRDRFEVRPFAFDEVIAAQSYGKPHVLHEKRRKQTLDLLKSDLDMKEIQRQYRKNTSWKVQLKRVAKNTVKRLPQGLYLRVKAALHKK